VSVLLRFFSSAGFVLALIVSTAAVEAQVATPTPAGVSFSQEILDAHNKYRVAVGVAQLVWSDELAGSAQAWVSTLNSNLQFAHDPAAGTQGQGENIWIGTTGAFSLTQMVDDWGSEQKNFQDGTFPNVSTTGSWSDVGHYSQIVWRATTSVGCAGAAGSDGNYRFVCRYSPAGNILGQQVF
jgi:Cysteine-rich secretory protein family